MDEGYEALTLMQTGKSQIMPLVLIDRPGGTYWRTWDKNMREHLLRNKLISPEDLYLYQITDDIEQSLSTQRHLDRIRTPLVLAHGTYETPEFKRQTRDFATALKNAGKPCHFFINENYNHFEMMETFGNPYGLLGRAVLTQMELPG